MNLSIFKIFAIFGVVSTWANKAFADGKISVQEGIELVAELADVLGIPLEWDVPEGVRLKVSEIREAHDALERDSPEIEEDLPTRNV